LNLAYKESIHNLTAEGLWTRSLAILSGGKYFRISSHSYTFISDIDIDFLVTHMPDDLNKIYCGRSLDMNLRTFRKVINLIMNDKCNY
jgi:hypothetical protein